MNVMLEQEIEEVTDFIDLVKDESFKLTNIDGLNWAFRKLRAYQTKKNEIDNLRNAELDRINNWHKKETEQLNDSMSYFENLVKEYYREARAIDPKIKLSTPYGKISTRKSTKWNYTDEAETIKYLTDAGLLNAIRVKQEVNKEEIKKLCKNGINQDTGEIIPGIIVKEEESITIKVVE